MIAKINDLEDDSVEEEHAIPIIKKSVSQLPIHVHLLAKTIKSDTQKILSKNINHQTNIFTGVIESEIHISVGSLKTELSKTHCLVNENIVYKSEVKESQNEPKINPNLSLLNSNNFKERKRDISVTLNKDEIIKKNNINTETRSPSVSRARKNYVISYDLNETNNFLDEKYRELLALQNEVIIDKTVVKYISPDEAETSEYVEIYKNKDKQISRTTSVVNKRSTSMKRSRSPTGF